MQRLSLYDEMKEKELEKVYGTKKTYRAAVWGPMGPKLVIWDAEQGKLYQNKERCVWARMDPKSLSLGEIGNLLHATEFAKEHTHVSEADLDHVRREVEVTDVYGANNVIELSRVMHMLTSCLPNRGDRYEEVLHAQPALAQWIAPTGGISPEHPDLLKLDTIRGLDKLHRHKLAELDALPKLE